MGPSLNTFVTAVARSSGMLEENGPLLSLLQKLQATLNSGKMVVVICPRAALVSEKYVRTRMRMWGAIAKYKVEHHALRIANPDVNALSTVPYLLSH